MIKNKLKENLEEEKYLLFYKIMKYPVPKEYEYFFYEKKKESKNMKEKNKTNFSREKKCPYIDEFITYINSFGTLYRSLPFVEEIYLCNSITFNALKKDSDIDIFIVVKNNRLWLARFWSLLFFSLLNAKRSLKDKEKKFCLSFYITSEEKNLYKIMIPKTDIYLTYRIAHLVSLYQRSEKELDIFKQNKRYTVGLQNHPQKQTIFLGNRIFTGDTLGKKIIEGFSWGVFGDIGERCIQTLRKPIILGKIQKDPERNKDVIISKTMLKFHKDIREKISFLYTLATKK